MYKHMILFIILFTNLQTLAEDIKYHGPRESLFPESEFKELKYLTRNNIPIDRWYTMPPKPKFEDWRSARMRDVDDGIRFIEHLLTQHGHNLPDDFNISYRIPGYSEKYRGNKGYYSLDNDEIDNEEGIKPLGPPTKTEKNYEHVNKLVEILTRIGFEAIDHPLLKAINFIETIPENITTDCLVEADEQLHNFNCNNPALWEIIYLPVDRPITWYPLFDSSVAETEKYKNELIDHLIFIAKREESERIKTEEALRLAQEEACELDTGPMDTSSAGISGDAILGIFGAMFMLGDLAIGGLGGTKEVIAPIIEGTLGVVETEAVILKGGVEVQQTFQQVMENINIDALANHIGDITLSLEGLGEGFNAFTPALNTFAQIAPALVRNSKLSFFEAWSALIKELIPEMPPEVQAKFEAAFVTLAGIHRITQPPN